MCFKKIRQVLVSGTIKPGVWSRAEDDLLNSLIKSGYSWRDASNHVNSVIHGGVRVRNTKHCRERWDNYLSPNIERGPWSHQEDLILLREHMNLGSKWKQIASLLGNRTGTTVKNRFNSLIKAEMKMTGVFIKESAVSTLAIRLANELSYKVLNFE